MANKDREPNPTGTNICVYNRELLLLVAANEDTICSRDVQRMDKLCRQYPILSVASVCDRIGWRPENTLKEALLRRCYFHYPAPYSPSDDIKTLCDADLLFRIRDDSIDRNYQITPNGEMRAEEIRALLINKRRGWKKESRENMPRFWLGEVIFTAQPDISPRCQPSQAYLVVREAGSKPLTILEKALLRLPFLPIL